MSYEADDDMDSVIRSRSQQARREARSMLVSKEITKLQYQQGMEELGKHLETSTDGIEELAIGSLERDIKITSLQLKSAIEASLEADRQLSRWTRLKNVAEKTEEEETFFRAHSEATLDTTSEEKRKSKNEKSRELIRLKADLAKYKDQKIVNYGSESAPTHTFEKRGGKFYMQAHGANDLPQSGSRTLEAIGTDFYKMVAKDEGLKALSYEGVVKILNEYLKATPPSSLSGPIIQELLNEIVEFPTISRTDCSRRLFSIMGAETKTHYKRCIERLLANKEHKKDMDISICRSTRQNQLMRAKRSSHHLDLQLKEEAVLLKEREANLVRRQQNLQRPNNTERNLHDNRSNDSKRYRGSRGGGGNSQQQDNSPAGDKENKKPQNKSKKQGQKGNQKKNQNSKAPQDGNKNSGDKKPQSSGV